jgi:hypothetical protein
MSSFRHLKRKLCIIHTAIALFLFASFHFAVKITSEPFGRFYFFRRLALGLAFRGAFSQVDIYTHLDFNSKITSANAILGIYPSNNPIVPNLWT